MASKNQATSVLLVALNLLFFTLVSSTYVPCPPPPPKGHKPHPKTPPKVAPTPPRVAPTPPRVAPTPPKVGPMPPPAAPKATCPKDTLKLGVCATLLNDLVNLVIGSPAKTPCCSLIAGLTDLEAAVCLCTAIKANILGINLNVPVSLSLLLNYCGNKVPSDFQCA